MDHEYVIHRNINLYHILIKTSSIEENDDHCSLRNISLVLADFDLALI